jgi:hypothetical protein
MAAPPLGNLSDTDRFCQPGEVRIGSYSSMAIV